MIKNFWTEVNEKYNYRFFTGIPFKEAAKLYKSMDSDIMHYIPASNETIALRLAAGAWISGIKSGVLLDSFKVNKLDFNFNTSFGIPVLLITAIEDVPLRKGLFFNKDLDKVISYIEKNNKPAAFILN